MVWGDWNATLHASMLYNEHLKKINAKIGKGFNKGVYHFEGGKEINKSLGENYITWSSDLLLCKYYVARRYEVLERENYYPWNHEIIKHMNPKQSNALVSNYMLKGQKSMKQLGAL